MNVDAFGVDLGACIESRPGQEGTLRCEDSMVLPVAADPGHSDGLACMSRPPMLLEFVNRHSDPTRDEAEPGHCLHRRNYAGSPAPTFLQMHRASHPGGRCVRFVASIGSTRE